MLAGEGKKKGRLLIADGSVNATFIPTMRQVRKGLKPGDSGVERRVPASERAFDELRTRLDEEKRRREEAEERHHQDQLAWEQRLVQQQEQFQQQLQQQLQQRLQQQFQAQQEATQRQLAYMTHQMQHGATPGSLAPRGLPPVSGPPGTFMGLDFTHDWLKGITSSSGMASAVRMATPPMDRNINPTLIRRLDNEPGPPTDT